jgi:uncharacterized protein (DUF697 family)
MSEKAASQQLTLVTHALLVGLTPLIPLPLADDMAKRFLQERMVRSLARKHGVAVDEKDLPGMLSVMPNKKGCLQGCLVSAIAYPFKKLARKIFFFLEIKRAVDLTSYTYHYGYLLDYAMREGWFAKRGLKEIDAALDEICIKASIKPVEAAIRATFRQSKRLLLLPVSLVEAQLRRVGGEPTPEQVAEGLRAAKTDENQAALNTLAGRLQGALAEVPEEHFQRLRESFISRLQANA